ncbi:DUF721 domain-containing protein [Streptomyces sp. NPDC005900]|uniref:DUF721 domain-containing protein n=1 Tax=Streptomyces sp. NPDC005900 TaxID=3154569 RepID=UPI0033EC9DD8
MTTPEPSGVDLARAALAAARAAAKTRPTVITATKKKPQRVHRHGRDPISFGTAISGMMAERGWEPPEQGGSVIDQWPAIAPELAPHVLAARFEHETGTLHLQPVSPAYATQLRMFQAQLVRRIHEKTGSRKVRRLRILPVGAWETASPEEAADPMVQPSPTPPPPIRTRDNASPGYRRALETARSHKPAHPTLAPHIQAAIDRQEAILADLGNREPFTDFTDAVAEVERHTPPELDRTEAARQAAIARKRAGGQLVRRAFDVA